MAMGTTKQGVYACKVDEPFLVQRDLRVQGAARVVTNKERRTARSFFSSRVDAHQTAAQPLDTLAAEETMLVLTL